MPQPTRKQLIYLKALSDRTGQTFAYPTTCAQASREIARLKHTPVQSHGERRFERKLIADRVATGLNNTAARADETSGHGSAATWSQNRHTPERIASSHRPKPRPAGPVVGERVELARYTVTHGGERILYGQRVEGRVRVTDRPAGRVDQQHRAHLIDNNLESQAELDALITDYLDQATRLQSVPAQAMPYDIALSQLAQRA